MKASGRANPQKCCEIPLLRRVGLKKKGRHIMLIIRGASSMCKQIGFNSEQDKHDLNKNVDSVDKQ